MSIHNINKNDSVEYADSNLPNNISFGDDIGSLVKEVDKLLWYLDNNYIDKFSTEFNKFGWINKLKELLKGLKLDKLWVQEFYLNSRVITLLIFISLVDKKQDILLKNLKEYILRFFSVNVNYSWDYEKYFSAINTVISYSWYFICNMLFLKEDITELVNVIAKKLDEFYKDLSNNLEKFDEIDFRKKAVFVSNLKLINIFNNDKFNYTQFFERFDINTLKEDAYKYVSFLMDYSWFVVDFGNWKISENWHNFPSFLSVIKNISTWDLSIKDDLLYLSNYSAFLNVKVIANRFLSTVENINVDIHKVNFYVDSLQKYFSSQIVKVPPIFLKDFIKSLVIRFYDLHLQLEDLYFNIIFFKKSLSIYIGNYLDGISTDDTPVDKNNYKEIYYLLSDKFNLGIKLWLPLDNEEYNEFNKNKVDAIINEWMLYVSSLNDFYTSLEVELKKLENHPETISHMERISKLFMVMDKFFPSEIANILNDLQTRLLLPKKSLYELFAFLHDIGKANNLKNLDIYNSFNSKLFAISNFSLILWSIFSEKEIQRSTNEKNSISKQINHQIEIKNFIKDNELKLNKIVNEFNLQINPISLLRFFNSDTFDYIFLRKIMKVYDIISDDNIFSIVKPSFKEGLSIIIENLLKKVDINIENIDINRFLFALLVFLEKISDSYISELTIPHIKYWIDFFAANSDFNYLSWVLLHHNYPDFSQFKEVWLHKWLIKWAELTNNANLKKVISSLDLNKPFPNQDKDFFMVLLTSLDIIDALMGNRAYQNSCDSLKLDLLDSILTSDFKDYIDSILNNEQLNSPKTNLDKALDILDSMFSNNPNWGTIKEILLKSKWEILSLYKK